MTKTALITGASSGIGEVFARQLARQGHRLILVARSKAKLDKLAAELSGTYRIEVDVITADLSEMHAALTIYERTEQLGVHVDLLINNAGSGLSGEFLSHSAEQYLQQIALNITAVVELTHLYLPRMVAKGEGTIINLASLLSFFPFPYCSVYSATKAFVLSFTESLWEEYRHKGIKLLALCPGPTDTPFFDTAKDVETNNKRTPQQVVTTALKALERNKTYVIDGSANKLNAFLSRILSRKAIVTLFGSVIRKSMASK
ncbi:SDR family NAD(P)-dependent oxidoreductase [Paenibacillus sp. GCM10023248]|uniref:SDR family NAD(P)-dependent oxidoreductase n=1 Tax=unclassified Paenibacillus TaxID=185978 RepID=UPI002378667D|nr:SDR family oxidoreductase [Paenibacillus sp. MAHUQ-63]MDD9268833.1 SDR family oxidoreductase [Paenibacillus sp. MAHUQ-63]